MRFTPSILPFFLSVLLTSSFAKTYDASTVSLKPIALDFYTFTSGHRNVTSKINDIMINTYRNYPGLGGSRSDRDGTGYDVELGYMLTNEFEGFLLAGFTVDRPLNRSVVKDDLAFTPAAFYAPLDNAFHFKTRVTYNTSIGARYYYDMDSESWVPFLGFSAGLVFQGKTKALVFDHNPNRKPEDIYLGKILAQKSKVMGDVYFQLGIDYKITDTFCMTMMTGLKYQPRAGYKSSAVIDQFGRKRQINYRDHWNQWVAPFSIALKIVF